MSEDFPGGGATGALIRRFDWATTPLGPSAQWPMSLKCLVRTMLHSKQPMIVWWGPELTQLYNDAMLDSMRDKHPLGMGQPARAAWRQAWKAVGHELQRVVDRGDAIWNEDMYVPVDRNARIEDAYWTYSYSPTFGDDGERTGILIICTETTAGVVARRQLEHARRAADAAREELHAAFMQAPTPIAIVLGEHFTFSLANSAYEGLVGRPVLGKTIAEAFSPGEVDYFVPLLDRVYRTGEHVNVKATGLRLQRADGGFDQHYIDVSYQPYLNANQEIIGVISLINDVTAAVNTSREAEHQRQERARLFEREQALRLEAEAASRSRDEFLAMLGHELRNPLAPILMAVELMRGGEHFAREREIIARQSAQLAYLVDELLDVERVTRGKVQLRRAPVDLEAVLDKAAEQAAPLIAQRAHQLTRRRSPVPVEVDGDAVRLAQVVANLLNNAAKYTPPQGQITLATARVGNEAVITVCDNGPGLDVDLLPRLFNLFVQGERLADRAAGGLGLGLALVRQLVLMHGGTVSARNREGCGSEFAVRLPALEPTVRVPVAPVPQAPLQTVKRVLVVDDNADAAELLADFLRGSGHDVRVAHDGASALELLAAFPAEVAILDIGLPGMDGFELARRVRALPSRAARKLIALTGYGQPSDREKTKAAGFDIHLTKPVALDALTHLLAQ